MSLTLTVLNGIFAICRLDKSAGLPAWAFKGDLSSITLTPDELSIVCAQDAIPQGICSSGGWKCIKVEGPLDLSLTGVLASLAAPLARAGTPIFALSTYDTDYLLVNEADLEKAVAVLTAEGHTVKH